MTDAHAVLAEVGPAIAAMAASRRNSHNCITLVGDRTFGWPTHFVGEPVKGRPDLQCVQLGAWTTFAENARNAALQLPSSDPNRVETLRALETGAHDGYHFVIAFVAGQSAAQAFLFTDGMN